MQEIQSIFKNRQTIYQILAVLYQKEVDEKLLGFLKGITFPEGDDKLGMTGRTLNEEIQDLTPRDLDDLAADYARTFLSAGVADEPAAFPIESVYTSREKLIMQDAYESVLLILKKYGLAPSKKDLYPDHLGVELEFMAFLCKKTIEALDEGNFDTADKMLEEQKEFLQRHLLNWTGKFFDDQKNVASTRFYLSLAAFAEAFLFEERNFLIDGSLSV